MLPLTRSRNRARFFGIPFSPAALFEGGTVAGAWYDPSDLSTMFTTSAGTTPVAMPGLGAGVAVGLILDKSGNGNHARSFGAGLSSTRPELRARVNLLTYSEEFDNGVWSQNLASVSANVAASPINTQTADRLSANGVSGNHWVIQSFPDRTENKTFVFFAKAETASFLQILFGTDANPWANFDVVSGAVGSIGSNITASISDAGNGWYRCAANVTSATATAVAISIVTSATDTRAQANSLSTSVLIWGADLRPANIGANVPAYQRIADANTYDTSGFPLYLRFDGIDDSMYTPASIPFATVTSDGQARRNLLLNPTQFDAAAWAVNGSTVTANATVSPDGTATADAVISTATTGVHQIRQSATVVNGSNLVFSFYARANGYNFVRLWEDATTGRQAYFNLVTGVATNVDFASVSIEAAGSGWYRCIATLSAIGGTTAGFRVLMTPDGINTNFAGDGTSGVFLWGAQLETGSTATAFQNIGTDKVAVFAGVRKLSDVFSIVAELSSSVSANNGTFGLWPPGFSGNWAFASKGTTLREPTISLPAPNTSVLTGIGDISGDIATLRANGVASTNTGDQGTGNYGTYPLFIGARNNASAWLNGQIYSLIIAGSAVSAGNISATEQWVAGKTGIVI